MSGEALAESDMALWALSRISGTEMTEANAVPLVMAMVRLVRSGMAMRTACGITTLPSAWAKDSPVDRAASHCPRGIAVMAAQKASSAKAASTSPSPSAAAAKALIVMPAYGRPKYAKTMTMS